MPKGISRILKAFNYFFLLIRLLLLFLILRVFIEHFRIKITPYLSLNIQLPFANFNRIHCNCLALKQKRYESFLFCFISWIEDIIYQPYDFCRHFLQTSFRSFKCTAGCLGTKSVLAQVYYGTLQCTWAAALFSKFFVLKVSLKSKM